MMSCVGIVKMTSEKRLDEFFFLFDWKPEGRGQVLRIYICMTPLCVVELNGCGKQIRSPRTTDQKADTPEVAGFQESGVH